MKTDRFLNLLGLARRAGKIESGEYKTENALRADMAWLLILPDDASANTKRKFLGMARTHEVKTVIYGTKDALGHSLGFEQRSCVAVTDEGLANSLLKAVPEGIQVIEPEPISDEYTD